MTMNHIDQLTEWWENAEQGTPREGDWLIINEGDGDYAFEQATPGAHEEVDSIRIMSRAPKPKPAWHDAVAVIAHIGGNELPRVLVRDNDGAFVDGITGSAYMADRLRDVTPLIGAQVTNAMAVTALDYYYEVSPGSNEWHDDTLASMRRALTAALGLETE